MHDMHIRPKSTNKSPSPPTISNLAGFRTINPSASLAASQKFIPFMFVRNDYLIYLNDFHFAP